MRMALVFMAVTLLLCSCTSETEHGECVGINGQENPDKKYEYSAKNIILAVIFAELIAPPVIVILDELKCPVGDVK